MAEPVPPPDPPLVAYRGPALAALKKGVAAAQHFLNPNQAALEARLRNEFEKKQANVARNAANKARRAALENARSRVAESRAPYLYTQNIRNQLAREKAIAEAARIMGGKRTRKRKSHKRKTHKRR